MMIKDLVEKIEGQWQLERFVNGIIEMRGVATIQSIAEGQWRYQESGQWQRESASAPLDFFQAFLYKAHEDQLLIFKQEGTLLHSLFFKNHAGKWIASHTHKCVKDNYTMTFFIELGRFQIHYKVNGPKKNYTLQSIFKNNCNSG